MQTTDKTIQFSGAPLQILKLSISEEGVSSESTTTRDDQIGMAREEEKRIERRTENVQLHEEAKSLANRLRACVNAHTRIHDGWLPVLADENRDAFDAQYNAIMDDVAEFNGRYGNPHKLTVRCSPILIDLTVNPELQKRLVADANSHLERGKALLTLPSVAERLEALQKWCSSVRTLPGLLPYPASGQVKASIEMIRECRNVIAKDVRDGRDPEQAFAEHRAELEAMFDEASGWVVYLPNEVQPEEAH